MDFAINSDWLKGITDSYSNYKPTVDEMGELASSGVFVHNIVAPELGVEFVLDGFSIDKAQIVISYGIVHHCDFNAASFLIPINTNGYCFKFTDWAGAPHEQSDLGYPVAFRANEFHSLAPFRPVRKPFIAIVLDVAAESVTEAIAA